MARNIPSLGKALFGKAARTIYRNLPISYAAKLGLKNFIYGSFGFLIRNTPTYRHWNANRLIRRSGQGTPVPWKSGPVIPVPRTANNGGPLVSVIVPVHNHLEFTRHCLDSIAKNAAGQSLEVIVVDDKSEDETPTVVPETPRIRYVRNEQNLGFVRACNRGASIAKGKYLLFLNNDTEVQPGWLEELVATFDLRPDAGLVGSKLIFPDGRLQEAGGIVWQDGSAWNYGRYDDPDNPEYNHLREVDYLSGASIMIPKDLFEQLGGFDELYCPAYYEDTDLAFKVRRLGLKVLYQPLSSVIHHEGITSGRDAAQGVKSYQVVNAGKFHDRWQDVLRGHGTSLDGPEIEIDRAVSQRALFIDARTPTPDQDSGSADTVQIIKVYQELGYKVTFIPEHSLEFLGHYTRNLQRTGVECLYAPYVTSIETYLKTFGARFDVVVLFRGRSAAQYIRRIRRHCPNAKVIFHTVDVHYLREERQAALEKSADMRQQAAETKRAESEVIRRADCTIVVSSAELEILARQFRNTKLFLVPLFRDIPGRAAPYERREGIAFFGGFRHPPNVDGVRFFVEEIWPLIKRELPGITFYVVGSEPPKEILDLAADDVIVTGYVEDLADYLNRCRLTVAPLRYGAGAKGKVVSSLAHGVPCVLTPVAAEGMDLAEGEEMLLGNEPEAFAGAVVQLYSNAALWQKLSDKGLAFALARFSPSVGRLNIARLLSDVGAKPFRGKCNVCGRTDTFKVTSDNLRESLICPACGSTSRVRALADGLLRTLNRLRLGCVRELATRGSGDVAILDTDDLSAISACLRGTGSYRSTMYLPDEPNGKELAKGVWNVDLMAMPFDDASFDVILTSDVLEHVRRAELAHREIYRCLRPGGAYIFTVPYVPRWASNQIRVDTSGENDLHLMEPEYHADPLDPEGALVYRIFGRELFFDLQTIGFDVSFERLAKPDNGILAGDLWICRKAGSVSALQRS